MKKKLFTLIAIVATGFLSGNLLAQETAPVPTPKTPVAEQVTIPMAEQPLQIPEEDSNPFLQEFFHMMMILLIIVVVMIVMAWIEAAHEKRPI